MKSQGVSSPQLSLVSTTVLIFETDYPEMGLFIRPGIRTSLEK